MESIHSGGNESDAYGVVRWSARGSLAPPGDKGRRICRDCDVPGALWTRVSRATQTAFSNYFPLRFEGTPDACELKLIGKRVNELIVWI